MLAITFELCTAKLLFMVRSENHEQKDFLYKTITNRDKCVKKK